MRKKAVLISCFDWYKSRLEPIRELLREKGYDVIVLESDYDHIKKEPVAIRYQECTYIHVPEYNSNLSIFRIRSHLSFGKSVAKWLERITPAIIYCLVPPNNVSRICTNYKKKHENTKLVLDIIDLWPESMPLGKLKESIPCKIWRNWRDKSIRAADYVFTECSLYQDRLKYVLDMSKTR